MCNRFFRRREILRLECSTHRDLPGRLFVRHTKGKRHGPAGCIVKDTVVKSSHRLKHGLHHQVLRLCSGDYKRFALFKTLAIEAEVFSELVSLNPVIEQQGRKSPSAVPILRSPKHISLCSGLASLFECCFKKFALVVEQGSPVFDGSTHGSKAGPYMIANGKGEGNIFGTGFLHVSPGTRLLEHHAQTTVDIGVGRTIAGIGIVIDLLGKVQGSHLIEGIPEVGCKEVVESVVIASGYNGIL